MLIIRAIRKIQIETRASMWKKAVELWKPIASARLNCSNSILAYNPQMGTNNLGDEIISYYCEYWLRKIFEGSRIDFVPTQQRPNKSYFREVDNSCRKFVLGTNLLNRDLSRQGQWLFYKDISKYSNLILMGCGWNSYL